MADPSRIIREWGDGFRRIELWHVPGENRCWLETRDGAVTDANEIRRYLEDWDVPSDVIDRTNVGDMSDW